MLYNEQKIALETADKIYDLIGKLFGRKLREICDDNAERIKHGKYEMNLFERFDNLTDFYKEATHLIRLTMAKIKSEPVEDELENLDNEEVK